MRDLDVPSIRQAMTAQHVSSRRLAARTGGRLSHNTICKILKGAVALSDQNKGILAAALGIDVSIRQDSFTQSGSRTWPIEIEPSPFAEYTQFLSELRRLMPGANRSPSSDLFSGMVFQDCLAQARIDDYEGKHELMNAFKEYFGVRDGLRNSHNNPNNWDGVALPREIFTTLIDSLRQTKPKARGNLPVKLDELDGYITAVKHLIHLQVSNGLLLVAEAGKILDLLLGGLESRTISKAS